MNNPPNPPSPPPHFQSSFVFYFNTQPDPCEYQKALCPPNIPKYYMKCGVNKNICKIKRYFDRFKKGDLESLGIGGMK